MTAQSAPDANHFLTEIRLPGTDRHYEIRDVLRGMGPEWEPATHASHGRLLAAQRTLLERRSRLVPKVVVLIAVFERAQVASNRAPAAPRVLVGRPRPPAGPRGSPCDYLRTWVEARLAFPGEDEDAEEIATPTRRPSLRKITNSLPDDSREADEGSGPSFSACFRGWTATESPCLPLDVGRILQGPSPEKPTFPSR